MALTNALLKSMGIEQDQRDQIMAEHRAVVDSVIAERDELRDKAAKVPSLEKEIEDLKAAQPKEDWEAKYNEKVAELESFKEQVTDEKAKAEKANLYRAALREVGIGERFIEDIMGIADLTTVSVENGELADAENVKAKAAEKYSTFITHTNTQGASVDNPPNNSGGKMTRDEIMAIKDTSARQKAIAENIDQFR